jgi:hypothetical protein
VARRGDSRRRKALLYAVLVVFSVIGIMALIAWSATRFEDDFNPPKPGWLVGPDPQGTAIWSFSAGAYEAFISRPEAVTWSLNPTGESFSEFCVDIVALLTSFASGEVGLAFAARDGDGNVSFQSFGVFRDGSYRLGRLSQGLIEDLPVATEPLKLQPADFFNDLRVVARDGVIRFYGNGELLATLDRKDMGLDPTGEIGFFGRSTEPFATGRFDSIRIMTPDCEP